MRKDEYIETLIIGDVMVNVGIDDYGQCYFIEYVEDGELKEESCGTYNFDYKEYAEYVLGDPERDCKYYDSCTNTRDCKYKYEFGYCSKCKYRDIRETAFQTLVKAGIIDRRGNIQEAYKDIFSEVNLDG
jgi:hypothetical protein